MLLTYENNYTRLCGAVVGAPQYSHTARGEQFYTFPLEVRRLSGNTDTLNIIVRKTQLGLLELCDKSKLSLVGQLRTYNNRRGDGAKLVITVLAKELCFCDEEDENTVILVGTICKPPTLRTTPMGRDICDMMLAVNRSYGRSDYLPCICWGMKAREAAAWDVGTSVRIDGRIQSRRYIKLIDGLPEEKTAFEVSAIDIALAALSPPIVAAL